MKKQPIAKTKKQVEKRGVGKSHNPDHVKSAREAVMYMTLDDLSYIAYEGYIQ